MISDDAVLPDDEWEVWRRLMENLSDVWKLDRMQAESLFGDGRRSADSIGRMDCLVRIHLGLDCLYSGDREAVMAWIRLRRRRFGNRSALHYMISGSMTEMAEVAEMVDRERGIHR